jgi:hypothetical protein
MISATTPAGPLRSPPQQARTGTLPWKVAGLLLFSTLPLTFGVLRLLQLAGLLDLMPPIAVSAIPIVAHILGAAAYTLLGAIQFAPGLRSQWPNWHRAAGRVALTGAAVVIVSSLWLSTAYMTTSLGGLVLAGLRITIAIAMAMSIVSGFIAARRRQIALHKAWMIRAYALGLGAATQMFVLMAAEIVAGGAPTELNRALLMGLAWGINLGVAEWRIRRSRVAA